MANIDLLCKNCKNTFTVLFKNRKRQFCSRMCTNIYTRGENSPTFGKTYRTKETHPEWAAKISNTHVEKGHIVGEKNPMKNKEAAARMGKTRSKKFETNEEFRLMTSNLVKKAWEDGKFDGVKVGKCKWYKFVKADGMIINLQGTWELAYAKWLDKNHINFAAHKGRISYLDKDSKPRSYYPDFYLSDTDEYIDIKNKYHYSLNEHKWEYIRKSNPQLKIVILFEKDLKEKGIL